MENLPEEDRPPAMAGSLISGTTMKSNLGTAEFAKAVSSLVAWFLATDSLLDENIVTNSVEEILQEYGKLTNLALQTAIRKRYAQKIYAVVQPPSILINPLDPGESRNLGKYKFTPLTGPSEIRLFKFRKFITLGSQVYISCDIVKANLDDKPVYTTISYVWGSLDNIVPVLIGDDECLMITTNLMEVLYRFSGANTPTDTLNTTSLFWTDQLCINQYDSGERGKQVVMMRRIYSEAHETKLWLGEEDEVALQAFDLIRCFECVETDLSLPDLLSFHGIDSEDIRQRFFAVFPQAVGRIPPKTDPRWKALFVFLDRPWFSRLWVFQEAILSSNKAELSIVCGQMHCGFGYLYLARCLLFVDWDAPSLPPGFQMMKHLMHFCVCRNLTCLPSISYTVWQIGGLLHSQDPRDRIFGLLALQESQNDIHFPIDYKNSVEDVYIDFTLRCIEKDQCLRVLGFIKGSLSTTIPNLPSWVPDWSINATTTFLDDLNIGDPPNLSKFEASAHLQYNNSTAHTVPKQNLVVKGKIIDQVVTEIDHDFEIATPIQVEQYFSANFRVKLWFMFLEHGIERGQLRPATAIQLKIAIIRTILAGGTSESLASQNTSSSNHRLSDDEAVVIYDELEVLRELSSNGLPHDGSNKELHRKIWVHTENCRGRRLALLEKYWITLGPSRSRKGDSICILHGSNVPWVLRPKQEAGTYEVIGQCFVDGVMYGEAVDWLDEDADTFILI
jgi:hypothetical protein